MHLQTYTLAPRVPVFGQITRREHQAGWTLT